MRDLFRHLFDKMDGFKISGSARNGAEARLEVQRRRPDLVLLDEILPGESSQDLLTELIAQKIPVVLVTGLDHPTHAIPAGAAARAIKPGWKTLDQDRARFAKVIAGVLAG